MNDITNLELEFENNTIGKLYVTPDWVKWLWTSARDKLNVTVIEFSITALKVLSRSKYVPLESAIPKIHAKVSVFDYDGKILSGNIINVTGDVIELNIFRNSHCRCPYIERGLECRRNM